MELGIDDDEEEEMEEEDVWWNRIFFCDKMIIRCEYEHTMCNIVAVSPGLEISFCRYSDNLFGSSQLATNAISDISL